MRMHIITIPLLQIRQISEMAGAALPWRRISMSGSMDELDKSRMSFR